MKSSLIKNVQSQPLHRATLLLGLPGAQHRARNVKEVATDEVAPVGGPVDARIVQRAAQLHRIDVDGEDWKKWNKFA
jgi:hypothetical protein